jgi:adenylate cyclase
MGVYNMPAFQISPKHKRNIFRILPFGLFWAAFGIIYSLMEKGLQNNNCLRCFFLIDQIFETVSEKYMKKFGLVPGFKAGLHYGKVTTGEIGVVKKEIIFTGDVLNTTSRIQNACKIYNEDILVSDDLIAKLKPEDEYSLSEMGEHELRGKDEKVNLQTVKINRSLAAARRKQR